VLFPCIPEVQRLILSSSSTYQVHDKKNPQDRPTPEQQLPLNCVVPTFRMRTTPCARQSWTPSHPFPIAPGTTGRLDQASAEIEQQGLSHATRKHGLVAVKGIEGERYVSLWGNRAQLLHSPLVPHLLIFAPPWLLPVSNPVKPSLPLQASTASGWDCD
jgi:hypothetical protein